MPALPNWMRSSERRRRTIIKKRPGLAAGLFLDGSTRRSSHRQGRHQQPQGRHTHVAGTAVAPPAAAGRGLNGRGVVCRAGVEMFPGAAPRLGIGFPGERAGEQHGWRAPRELPRAFAGPDRRYRQGGRDRGRTVFGRAPEVIEESGTCG
jgi:hypothetical protein